MLRPTSVRAPLSFLPSYPTSLKRWVSDVATYIRLRTAEDFGVLIRTSCEVGMARCMVGLNSSGTSPPLTR